MSEFSTGFVFDLQRFATKTFNGGAVGDETGVTLSDLFNNAGRAWLYSNVSKGVAEGQTFFWEKSALLELNPAVDNANETVAGALELVSGRYDDPTVDDQDVTVIKRVDAIDAENLTGAANFKTIGSTTIVNPGAGATIAIGNNTLTFGGGGNNNKDTDTSFGWDVGTRINVTNGSIKNVQAAATEEITTANGTTADFVNGGTATFSGKVFNTIESFANGGSAALNVYGDDAIVLEIKETSTPVNDGKTAITTTFDGQTIKSIAFAGNANSVSADIAFGGTANVGKDIAIAGGTVNVANIAGASATPVVYRLGAEGGDILDLTYADKASANKNISVSKTGKAKFLLATDYNKDGIDTDTITIGGTNYTFNDAADNGGLFVVSNNEVTGFVFRDAGDAIRIPEGASLTLYNGRPATENALSVGDNADNMSFADLNSLPVSFSVGSDSDYIVTKADDEGFTVEVFDGTTVTVGDATIDFTLPTTRENRKDSPTSAVLTFGNDGLLKSISAGNKADGTKGTGFDVGGTIIDFSGMNSNVIAEDFNVDGVEFATTSGKYEYMVEGDAGKASNDTALKLTSADDGITKLEKTDTTETKVILAETENAGDEEPDGNLTYQGVDYKYSSPSGQAHLKVDANGVRFVFVDEGDTLTIPEGGNINLYYRNNLRDATDSEPQLTYPTTNGDSYSITMTKATTKRDDVAGFNLFGIAADDKVTAVIDGNDATFEFSADGGKVNFTSARVITGFTVASGTVIMDANAATVLADIPDDDISAFTINGTEVNISAFPDTTGEVVYNKDENSLAGLAGGTAIVNAGSITKVYAPIEIGEFTFGVGDDAKEYTSETAGEFNSTRNPAAFFTVDGDTATGFTFADTDDEITADDFSGLTLTDQPTGNTFDAPVVTEGEDVATARITKTTFDYDRDRDEDPCYSIDDPNGDLEGKTITFGDGTVATFNAAANEPEVFFGTDGKLLNINNLNTQGDEVAIQNATGAVRIDESTVEIVGGAFVYRMVEDNVPAIAEVTAGTKILQAAGVSFIDTTIDDTANGTYTFGSASKAYTLAGNENGIRFVIDGDINVSGISNINGDESVTGAFGVSSASAEFSINGASVIVTTDDVTNNYTVTESTFTGLQDGDAVVSAGNITEFATAEDGLFTILGESMAINGDSAVKFTVAGESLTAVSELSGTATGNFDGSVMVNDARVEVVGDSNSSISVTGTEDELGITKVGGLGGESVLVARADGATQIGADGNGEFDFAFTGNNEKFGISGNSAVETTFDFANGVVAGISGVEDGERVTGDFTNGITVNGEQFVDVDNNSEDITFVKGSYNGVSGTGIYGLKDGAIVSTSGVSVAVLVENEGSVTFNGNEFAIAGDSNSHVGFDLTDDGNVEGIFDLDGSVTGKLNDVTINLQQPAISISSASAHDVTYDTAGILSGIQDGDTVLGAASATTVNAAQEGTFTFANGTFQVEGDADGLDFLVNAGTANVYGVNGLAADATLRGALDQLQTINGVSFAITGDSSFAIVGAASGISRIEELSGGANVINAGGASKAVIDGDGSFTFGGQSFSVEDTFGLSGVSAAVDGAEFSLNENSQVTKIDKLGEGAFVGSNAINGMEVNGGLIDVDGDTDGLGVVTRADGEGIAILGGVGASSADNDVTVKSAGGAAAVFTDGKGKFTFAGGSQTFNVVSDSGIGVDFNIDENEKVTAIVALDGTVEGDFQEGIGVNGISNIVKVAGDSLVAVTGSASGVVSIAKVSDGATVEQTGGASTVVTDTTGSFSFAGNTNAFEVTGDNSVTFTVDENVKVTGVSDLANGSVKGELTQASVNGASIAISNDKDDIISYAVDASNVKTLGDLDVGDNGVAIVSATGNANFVNLTSDGEFDFGGKRYTFAAGGSATLAINNDTDIVSIIGVETDGDYVSGDFTSAINVQGRAVHVTGDNDITVENVGGSAFVLRNISDSAVIEEAAGISYAYTDTTGTFTDADGKKLSFASDNSVELLLDGNARFIGASGVSGAVSGDITQLPEGINGGGSIYVITAPNGDPSTNLTIDGDVLSGVKDGDTVLATDGATSVQTDESGTFTFRTGDEQQGFTLENDADGALFGLDDKGNVVSISDVDEDATLTGAVNGLLVNGSEVSIAGDRDSIFGIVGGATGIKAVDAVGGEVPVTVVSAGGADSIVTDQAGVYIFEKSGDKFTVGGDSSVVFALNDGESVTAVGELEGTVAGDFTNARNVNAQRVQVTGDGDGISVVGAVDADGITAINDVDAGAVVVSSGDAAKVRTDGEGVYTFDGNVYVNAAGSLARQFASEKFSVTGDTSVTFELDDTGDVVGVSDFTSGQLEFNTTTTRAIKINPDEDVANESHTNDLNDELQFSTNDDATLTVDANGDVVGVAGIKSEYDDAGNRTKLGYVLGLENATVTATTPIYVGPNNSDVPNDKYYFEVDDGDDNYGVVVENFETTKLTSVTGGSDTAPATVNVQDGTIEVDKDGVFNVGGEVYTVADDNDVFTMTTDENRDLTGVSGLEGTVVIADGQEELTVNGNYVEFFNGRDSLNPQAVSVSSDGTNITDVKGLNNYDIINGNLDNASIAMGSVPAGENYSALAVNDTVFALIADEAVNGNDYDEEYFVGDADGVTINGQGQVVGLDDDARMYVTEEGTYTVNGTAIKAVVGDTIVGTSNGAYLYNPDDMLVRKTTSLSKIESLTGISQHGTFNATLGSFNYPVSREAVDEYLANSEYDKDQSVIIYATNPDTTVPQDIDLSNYRFTKQVHLFNGPQNVAFNNDGGNLAHVEGIYYDSVDGAYKATAGVKNIVLGSGGSLAGGDVVVIDEGDAIGNEVNILGGDGADTIFVRDNVRTNFNMALGGKDKVVTFARANARINVENYDASTGAGIQFEQDEVRDSVGGIAGAIDKGIIDFGDGVISLKTASGTTEVSLNGTTGGTNGLTGGTNSVGGSVVNLFTPEGKEQKVAFTHLAGGVAAVDVSDTDDVILIGNKNDAKRGDSTLLGGFGNDTVFAGEGDFINAYGGNNYINMAADDNREGAYIEITAGTTVIENMNNTLDQIHGDTLGIDLTTMEVEYDGTNLLVKSRTADSNVLATIVAADKDTALVYDTATETASTETASSDLAESADEAEETTGETTTEGEDTVATAAVSPLVADHNYTNQIINSNGTLIKAAVGAKGSVIDVKKDEDVRANYYKGEDSGLVFDFYNGNVFIDLEGDWLTTGSSIDGTAVALEGITSIHAGTELNYVKGSEANETFIAGRGETHLYGDGGKNLLIGYDGTDGDKEGQTIFYVLGNAYYAANTIQAFNFVDDDNYTNNSKITADKLEFDLPTNHVSKVAVSNDDVVVEVTKNGSFVMESVVIEDAIDTVSGTAKDILIAGDGIVEDVIAQVGTDKLHFDKFANYYNATGKNATISVDNDKDYAQVWLDGSKGVNFQGDIHVIDASTFTGQAELAGNDYNNIIIASTVEGSGAQSLWGGHRGDDALIAGASQNTFFYTAGNGTDTIYGAKDGDIVNLAGVTLDQLDTANFAFSETGVKLAFKDGGALYVGDNGGNSVSYVINGETYFVNESHNGFTKKA